MTGKLTPEERELVRSRGFTEREVLDARKLLASPLSKGAFGDKLTEMDLVIAKRLGIEPKHMLKALEMERSR